MSGSKFLSCAFVALQSGVALSALALSAPAVAQTQTTGETAQSDETDDSRDIVVTGTQIRGIEPVGSPVIGVNREAVLATGATSVNQLLTTIPQIASFNEVPIIGNGGNSAQLPVSRPRIRGIGGNDAGASATLILIDGHRVVGAGLRQTSPDPDIIPPGALERVEVIPDGGSSIYGADAVAGVINFITRRRFDGIQIEGRYGFADDYYQYDVSATAGKSWDTGSAYVSYNFAKTDDILGRDRDYVRRFDYVNNRAPDLTCNPGNVQVGSALYTLPGLTLDPTGRGNRCDGSDLSTAFPKTQRHSVFGAFSQDIGDSLKLDVRAFFTRRTSTMNNGPAVSGAASIGANNFYRQPLGTVPCPATGAAGGCAQSASFNWEPVTGASYLTDQSSLSEWGITPTLTWDIGDNWQFRGMFNYSESITTVRSRSLNPTLLQAALRGENPEVPGQFAQEFAINPYNIAATQNKDLLARITNWENFAQNKQKLLNVRGIVDGKLLSWGGGDIRLAAGVEFTRESVAPRSGSGVLGGETAIPIRVKAHRDIKSAFGELFIPIVSDRQNGKGAGSLSLSLSGRYDNYSDVGSTFNPKVGLTFEPSDWFKVRGSWGTSFNAPSLADTIGSPDGGIGALAQQFVGFLSNPDSPADPTRGSNQPIVNATGAFPGVKPQTATTFSMGFDAKWPFAPGLSTSLSYYYVDFKDQISLPPVFLGAAFYRQFTNLYIMYPTRAQIEELAKLYPTGLTDIASLYDPGDPDVYILLDARRRNLGRSKVTGLDFTLNYVRPTGFGAIDMSFAGTYELKREGQAFNGAPFVDGLLRDASRFRFAATVGATIGDHLRAQLTWNHTQGYELTKQAAFNNQDKVSSFNVFNFYARYDLKGERFTRDLALTLNVNNVFDTPPPLLQGFSLSSQGFTNGNTIGRLVQFGVSKKF